MRIEANIFRDFIKNFVTMCSMVNVFENVCIVGKSKIGVFHALLLAFNKLFRFFT